MRHAGEVPDRIATAPRYEGSAQAAVALQFALSRARLRSRDSQATRIGEQGRNLLGWHRTAKQKPLSLLAAVTSQELQVLGLFNTFCHQPHPETAGEVRYRHRNRHVLVADCQLLNLKLPRTKDVFLCPFKAL